MATKKIRWGVIGLGSIAAKFISDLHYVPNAVLQGVASRSLEKATIFKEKHKAVEAYGSYQDLANSTTIDVVYIATPHILHFENAKLCLEAGKAVLCEKPMGMNAEQVTELCGIAKKNKVFLMEALWTAFHPNFNKLHDLIRSKKLGEVIDFKSDFGFKADYNPTQRLFNKELGGGSVLDIGIYPIFACLTLLGEPESISAKAKIGATNVDENCSMLFKYANSLSAELFSTLLEDTPIDVQIEFEKGTALLGPLFNSLSNLKITNSKGEITEYKKHPEGFGYQFEAIHVQEQLLANSTESNIMSHKRSIQLATYLDKVLNEIDMKY